MTDRELLQAKLRVYSECLDYPHADRKSIILEMQRLAFKLKAME